MRNKRSARCIIQGRAWNSDYYLCGGDRTYTFSYYKVDYFESRDECEGQGRLLIKFDTLTVAVDLLFMIGSYALVW